MGLYAYHYALSATQDRCLDLPPSTEGERQTYGARPCALEVSD